MKEVTTTRFAVVLSSDDPQFSQERARELLEASGCEDIRPLQEEVEEEGSLI
jgi:hypothetical protein